MLSTPTGRAVTALLSFVACFCLALAMLSEPTLRDSVLATGCLLARRMAELSARTPDVVYSICR